MKRISRIPALLKAGIGTRIDKDRSNRRWKMPQTKRIPAALAGFWRRSRIALIIAGLLAIGVVFAGLHDVGIVLGILAAMVIVFEVTRRWRRIRNYIILFFASILGIIFLAFLDEGMVKPVVRFLGGTGAVNSAGFEVFNQIISLIILFFGVACLLTGVFGTIVLGVWRLARLRKKPAAPAGT
jgi:hypothetical protein